MAKKKKIKLRPGKGAIAEVLPRYIKPPQPIPGNKRQKSLVVLVEEGFDANKRLIYRFYYKDDSEKNIMWANQRYVHMVEEGDHMLLFAGPGEPRAPDFNEPRIKWQYSSAKVILVQEVMDGNIMFDDDDKPYIIDENGDVSHELKAIYAMHPEYASYKFEFFEERLQSIWEKMKLEMNRADKDVEYFEEFLSYNDVAYTNKFGMIQWQKSDAQEQALVDIAENNVRDFGYRHLFDNNPVYNQNFTYEVFKDKMKQEIRTKKYLETLKVRDLQKKAKQNKGSDYKKK